MLVVEVSYFGFGFGGRLILVFGESGGCTTGDRRVLGVARREDGGGSRSDGRGGEAGSGLCSRAGEEWVRGVARATWVTGRVDEEGSSGFVDEVINYTGGANQVAMEAEAEGTVETDSGKIHMTFHGMAAKLNFSLMILLLYGMLLLGQVHESKGKECPQFCQRVEYMTCPSSGHKKLEGHCNCCLTNASKGCTLHIADADGSLVHCK
ncbi:hypothetical protein Dimus_007758 [Dionaea muscipula]